MPFIDQMVEDKARNRVVREIAIVDSEWPAHTGAGLASCSGYAAPTSGSGAVLVRVPSGFWFKPRTLWVDNQAAVLAHLTFYEGGSASACSGIINGLYIDTHTTNFVGLDCITVGKDVWVQADAGPSTQVRMGGILVASGAE